MVLIALGGNLSGERGSPLQTLQWAIGEMAKYRIYVMSISSFYSTKAIGQTGQPDYVNAVVRARTSLSAPNLLKTLKLIELAAGRDQKPRAFGKYWGPRPLDLDIVDYKSTVSVSFHVCIGYNDVTKRRKNAQCGLVLPHPQAHLRSFVMRPIVDILPLWHHPVLGLSAISLWSAMKNQAEGRIIRKID